MGLFARNVPPGVSLTRFSRMQLIDASCPSGRPAISSAGSGARATPQGDSGHVVIAVTRAFGSLQPVTEFEQLIKQPNRAAFV